MRFSWVLVLLAGCGTPAAIESPAPPVTRDHVEEGGGSISNKPPKTESLRSCSLDLESPFGGSSPGWRRETFDAKSQPRAAASSTLGLPVSYGDYQYDGAGRVIAAPVSGQTWTFAYFADRAQFEAFPTSGAYSLWDLDAHGRVTAQRATDDAGTLIASYTYDDAGRLTSSGISSTTTQSYTYDERGFLTSESVAYPFGASPCQRTWTWTHGDVERIDVRDETGRVTQRCSYVFDDEGRLTSAKCTYSSAVWQYDTDAIRMSLSQGSSVTNLELLKGECDAPLTRDTFARNFVPTTPDPRPSSDVFTRLRATPVPSPYKECASSISPPFGGE